MFCLAFVQQINESWIMSSFYDNRIRIADETKNIFSFRVFWNLILSITLEGQKQSIITLEHFLNIRMNAGKKCWRS